MAGALAAPLGASVEIVDLTLPGHRPADVSCGADDVLVFGFPVYAGRVPALLRDEFAHLIGQDTPAVIVGLYGNRDFDEALLEAARPARRARVRRGGGGRVHRRALVDGPRREPAAPDDAT